MKDTTMDVNTREVIGRRQVRYDRFHDFLLDAESLAAGEVFTLGNWTLGQIYLHLARTMSASIDGMPFEAAWWQRIFVRLFHSRRLVSGPMPAGLRLSDEFAAFLSPEPIGIEEGLGALRESIHRLSFEIDRARHPLLGEMSLDEWDSFHLRHAELHMSFALPLEVPVLV
jgi:hypothetical protein